MVGSIIRFSTSFEYSTMKFTLHKMPVDLGSAGRVYEEGLDTVILSLLLAVAVAKSSSNCCLWVTEFII